MHSGGPAQTRRYRMMNAAEADLPLRTNTETSHPGSGNPSSASGDEHDDGRGFPNVTNCKLDLQPKSGQLGDRYHIPSLSHRHHCRDWDLDFFRDPVKFWSPRFLSRTATTGKTQASAGRDTKNDIRL
jgi:hypothetical protein